LNLPAIHYKKLNSTLQKSRARKGKFSNDEDSALSTALSSDYQTEPLLNRRPVAVYVDTEGPGPAGASLPGMLGRAKLQTAPLLPAEVCSSRVFGSLDPKQPKPKRDSTVVKEAETLSVTIKRNLVFSVSVSGQHSVVSVGHLKVTLIFLNFSTCLTQTYPSKSNGGPSFPFLLELHLQHCHLLFIHCRRVSLLIQGIV